MRIRHQRLLILGLVIYTFVPALAFATGGMPAVVGKVVRSSNATLDGNRLLPNGTVLSGDAVTVGEDGLVLLSYSPTGRAVLAESTSVRFSSAKGNVVAQLISGTLAVVKQNQDAFVVKTSTYSIESQGEGRAEFVVALLPNKRATVETQRGKVLITDSRSGKHYTIAEGLLAEVSPSATEIPGQSEQQHKVIGKVMTSAGATENGGPLLKDAWVNDGDSVTTEGAGRTVIQLLPTNQVTLDEYTTVNFTVPVDRVLLQLLAGTIVLENKGDANVLIATTKFRIEPVATVYSSIFVSIKRNNSTYIYALTGDVRIRDVRSDQTYLLPSGQKTVIPADAQGVPGLQPFPGIGVQTPPQEISPSPPPPDMPPTQAPPPAGVKGPSNKTVIIVGVAAGGGIAALIAALAGGGGSSSHPPVSPSAP